LASEDALIISPPFDSATRMPAQPMPVGSCDCHLHVYGDPGRYPVSNPQPRLSPNASFENLRKMHAALGVSRAVLVQPSAYMTDNSLLIDTLEAAPAGHFRGVAIIDNATSDMELVRLHKAGVRAARFNFWKDLGMVPDLDDFQRSVERVHGLGWHIKLYASASDLVELHGLFRSLGITAMLDHMAHLDFANGFSDPAFQVALDLLQRDNWWILLSNGDRSSAGEYPWDDAVSFGRRMYEAAPDRCVWATDWPHLAYSKKMPNDAELVELLYRYLPDDEARRKVLVDNPARLYGFA
jgi:predicted TIM-barrel fold metal-dependent hydrolase